MKYSIYRILYIFIYISEQLVIQHFFIVNLYLKLLNNNMQNLRNVNTQNLLYIVHNEKK